MERIDQLESDIMGLQDLIGNIEMNKRSKTKDVIIGESQSLKDKEIIEFIGDDFNHNDS